MTRWTEFIDAPLYIHPNGREVEAEAEWRLDCEEYPAEPFSHGGSRGTELEVSAHLIRWGGNRTREDAVRLYGEDEIKRQEAWASASYSPEDV